jgi:hypothetical protein
VIPILRAHRVRQLERRLAAGAQWENSRRLTGPVWINCVWLIFDSFKNEVPHFQPLTAVGLV